MLCSLLSAIFTNFRPVGKIGVFRNQWYDHLGAIKGILFLSKSSIVSPEIFYELVPDLEIYLKRNDIVAAVTTVPKKLCGACRPHLPNSGRPDEIETKSPKMWPNPFFVKTNT
jgi:hypothetical protein